MYKNPTKFEKVRIIGARATQISNGAEPKIDISGLEDPIQIATKEYEQGKIPIILIRTYPKRTEEINIFK